MLSFRWAAGIDPQRKRRHAQCYSVNDGKVYNVGDTVCEILLKNANDGTSAHELMAGLFRVSCLNSLVTQTGAIDAIEVRHSGDVQHKCIEVPIVCSQKPSAR